MTKEEYLSSIKEAILNMNLPKTDLNESTAFNMIQGFDSMSVVDFQINLKKLIGPKADDFLPILEMTLGDFAELLASS